MWPTFKENTIIRIFCTSGWLSVLINPDKWRSTLHTHTGNKQNTEITETLLKPGTWHKLFLTSCRIYRVSFETQPTNCPAYMRVISDSLCRQSVAMNTPGLVNCLYHTRWTHFLSATVNFINRWFRHWLYATHITSRIPSVLLQFWD